MRLDHDFTRDLVKCPVIPPGVMGDELVEEPPQGRFLDLMVAALRQFHVISWFSAEQRTFHLLSCPPPVGVQLQASVQGFGQTAGQ